jgi:hypothetical protein
MKYIDRGAENGAVDLNDLAASIRWEQERDARLNEALSRTGFTTRVILDSTVSIGPTEPEAPAPTVDPGPPASEQQGEQ